MTTPENKRDEEIARDIVKSRIGGVTGMVCPHPKSLESDIVNALTAQRQSWEKEKKELENKLYSQTDELLYLQQHVTGGNDGLYLPVKQYNNLQSEITCLKAKVAELEGAKLLDGSGTIKSVESLHQENVRLKAENEMLHKNYTETIGKDTKTIKTLRASLAEALSKLEALESKEGK